MRSTMLPAMFEQITETLGEVFWSDLSAHAARDGLILVAEDLDLVEVGAAFASNDVARVGAWIDAGQLTKPTDADLARWSLEAGMRFLSVVVAPYVLVRRPAAPTLS